MLKKVGEIDGIELYYDETKPKKQYNVGYERAKLDKAIGDNTKFQCTCAMCEQKPIPPKKYEDIKFIVGCEDNIEYYQEILRKKKNSYKNN